MITRMEKYVVNIRITTDCKETLLLILKIKQTEFYVCIY